MSTAVDPAKALDGQSVATLCANTLRTLAMDAVQAANSGHPGMPMGCADFAYVLWTQFLKVNPDDPKWPDRDRFVLSAGHGSMLLYGLLHLTGFDLSLEEIKNFRQWGSLTPGHPESHMTPGVECTTGPLGQGISNAVGMAMAETWLAARFNRGAQKLVEHYTYVIAGDGDLEEGISSEACSLAGHWGLGRLIVFYDSNNITIDGPADLALSEDMRGRFEAQRWHVQEIDGHDHDAIETALRAAREETGRPSLIIGRTQIAYGSPNKANTSAAHGAPLGDEEIALTKRALGWPEDTKFYVPEEAYQGFAVVGERGRAAQAEWAERLEAARAADAELAREWDVFQRGELPTDLNEALPKFEPGKGVATRKSGGEVLRSLMKVVPNIVGGSADLAESNGVHFSEHEYYSREKRDGRLIHFGIREHAMGAIANGLAYHGGFRPFTATFLTFSDYMRPAIRLAALSHLNVAFIFTHDSIYLGEDGPTHQAIEHLAALRAIPRLRVFRPADATEAAVAWQVALEAEGVPSAMILTRQNVPTLDRENYAPAEGVRRGGYVLAGGPEGVTLMATGSEVGLALLVHEALAKQGVASRVVSLPCWEIFDEQDEAYRREVLGAGPRVGIEAGVRLGWDRYLGDGGLFVGMDTFGASAPGSVAAKEFGFDAPSIVTQIETWLAARDAK